MMTLSGCNKATADNNISKAKAELAARYPDATNVKWSSKNGYTIAKFNRLATRSANLEYDYSVWFNGSGTWCMTESEVTYNVLPEAVKTTFEASEYAAWKIDDIDKLERAGMETFYVIEIETKANGIEKEADIYFSETGVVIKVVMDVEDDYDYEDYLPADTQAVLKSFISQKYPGAVIMDTEYDDGEIEVEIVHEWHGKDVYFSKDNVWLRTKWDVRKSEIPAAVMNQLNVSYPSWKIDDAEYVETPSGAWFAIELEKGEAEVDVKIAEDGTIIR